MNYEDIFHARGGAYDEAMRRWPEARREEFTLAVQSAGLQEGDRVIDVPAGGGYLRRYLPPSVSWFGHEPCASLLGDATTPDQRLLPLPWTEGFAHAAISIAGVHHLTDRRPFFDELHRVLQPRGRAVVADLYADSGPARFLDDFVGRHTSTGHHGNYLDARTPAELARSGFEIKRAERVHYCWWFADRSGMGAFCRRLFDMREVDDDATADAIERQLGVESRGGEIGMNWELYVIAARRT